MWILLLSVLLVIHGKVVDVTWSVDSWVVDFLRPTVELSGAAERVSPYQMPDEQRSMKFLINGSHPGPTLFADLNDTVRVTVINNLISEGVTIHWHGVHMPGTPFMDGSRGVTQSPIGPGLNMTYEFLAFPAGTHYYHSHMDSVQSARGIRGAIVIRDPHDPFQHMYTEEKIVFMSDEWRDPGVCLMLEGAMPGNDVCADIRHASFNGQYGNGTNHYPYPIISVKPGVCYRMRFIMAASNTENFIMQLAGHNMTLLALDGSNVKPILVRSFNLHLGERVDVVVCTDQLPGAYLVNATYDYACTLTPGHFIPPGFSPVPACSFYAFLNYENNARLPTGWPPVGTGGGAKPKPVTGVAFDLTDRSGYSMTQPLEPVPVPEHPDVRFVINMGLMGPVYNDVTNQPLSMGRWYMDLDERRTADSLPRPWSAPMVPLYKSKGKYGVRADIPVFDIPERADGTPTEVEVVLNNLSPAAHMVHMHGMRFQVINLADFSWCTINRTDCFLMPYSSNPCPKENVKVGDPLRPMIELGGFWGCAYNNVTDKATQNLATPLVKDMIQVWQRSWAVIRFQAWNPGYWFFHCHMEQHIPLGMQTVLNVMPSKQPPVPPTVPGYGSADADEQLALKCEFLSKEVLELRQKLEDRKP